MRSCKLPVRLAVLAICSALLTGVIKSSGSPDGTAANPVVQGPFDGDPHHPWNRLFLTFFVRDMAYRDSMPASIPPELSPGYLGPDVLDPPLGFHPKFLLDDEPYAACNAALDEFLNQHADRLILDPLKRAVLQHDLWAIFDLLQSDGEDFMRNFGSNPKPGFTPVHKARKTALARKIAKVMATIALPREQLEKLPDTYAAAIESKQFSRTVADQTKADYLPTDLFEAKGPWVEVSRDSGLFQHTSIVGGRSVFRVFFGPPVDADGAKHWSDWLTGMREALKVPFRPDDKEPYRRIMDAMRQLPVGSRLLLLRQMACIDDKKQIVSLQVVESVQLRVYRTPHVTDALKSQVFEEYEMNRPLLFAMQQGGLRPTPGGKPSHFGYTVLGRLSADENGKILPLMAFPQNCLTCHVQSGDGQLHHVDQPDYEPQIQSVTHSMSFLPPSESKVALETVQWKSEQKDFKHLVQWMNDQ